MKGIEYLKGLAPWSGSFSGEWSLRLMHQLVSGLGDPHRAFPSIHVTGTNGKGSISVAIASILAKGGRKVGLTTSPHLRSINERIVIDGHPIGDELLNECGEAVQRAAVGLAGEPTFFEGITAAAFLAFKLAKVDFGVVEVGLGGRLDATNVLPAPLVSVIATIAFDHEQILGDSLGRIAREKAGIFKVGSQLVVGEVGSEAYEEIEQAALALNSRINVFGREYRVVGVSGDVCRFDGFGCSFEFRPTLQGAHQVHNMGVAIAAAILAGATVDECIRGVNSVVWPGRLERFRWCERDVIIDAAHNPAGIESLTSFLKARGIRPECAFGAIETKNWRSMVGALSPYVTKWAILEPDFPKAVPAHEIVEFLSCSGISSTNFGRCYTDFREALSQGRGPVLIAGSIYLIGIIRSLLSNRDEPLWRK
jgi:dihydrofolate synthase/folylpolyglutamate synthase